MRFLPLLAVALALIAAAPPSSLAQTAEQEFSRMNADRAHRLGVQQYRLKNYELALRHFEKAVALAPDIQAYRQSLALTKQRIAVVKANQRAVQESINRSRMGLIGEEVLSNPFGDDDSNAGASTLTDPSGAATDAFGRPNRGGTASRAKSPGDAPIDDGTLPPSFGMRDPVRDLGLGGRGQGLIAPTDLPIAGSGAFDLPIGRLPPELNPALSSLRSDTDANLEPPVPTSGEGSMFPFLDPPADPVVVRPRSIDAAAPDAGGGGQP
jgi:hypothetical protein